MLQLQKGATVLFVDDQPEIIELCADSFHKLAAEPYGLNLRFVTDPVEAIELANQTRISLLVTDLNMPNVDGLALLREVRHVNVEVQAFLTTGRTRSEEWVTEALRMGFRGVFSKPLSLGILERRILELFPADLVSPSPALA